MASLVFSIPVVVAGRTLAFAAGLPAPAFIWIAAAACSICALVLRLRAWPAAPADRVSWWIVGALGLLVALPAGLNSVIRVYGDAMFHAQIVNEIRLRGLPPQDPSFAGIPLTYMWQFHVWITALVEATGLTPYGVFPWVGGAMMCALAFGAFRAASLFWPETPHRRLAPAVVALGMNAPGWLLLFAFTFVAPLVGAERGAEQLRQRISETLLHPSGNGVCALLIYKSHFILCSLLFKFFCANALGAALALVVAAFVLVAAYVREGGSGRLVAIAIAGMSVAVIHPLVGVPAVAASIVGLALAATVAEGRGAAVRAAAALGIGLGFGATLIFFMLHSAFTEGERTRVHFLATNLPALIQGLDVVLLPAAWGWVKVFRRAKALALFGLGFVLASLAFALLLDLPYVGGKYLVYGTYLGVALFAAAGVGAILRAITHRVGAAPAWALAALVFLPNALLQFNGFARQSNAWGLSGYPETRDEVAVFDWLRDRTPLDAVVIDVQYFASSSVAAYSGRRGFFGGMRQATLVGYPRDEMAARERAVVNLLYETRIRDATWRSLDDVRGPLYVVARRTPPRDRVAALPPEPLPDPIARLDSLEASFAPAFRTPTIVLYRYVRDGRGHASRGSITPVRRGAGVGTGAAPSPAAIAPNSAT